MAQLKLNKTKLLVSLIYIANMSVYGTTKVKTITERTLSSVKALNKITHFCCLRFEDILEMKCLDIICPLLAF